MKFNNITKMLLATVVSITMIGCGNTVENSVETSNNVNNEEVVVATSVAVTEILDALGVKVSGVPTTSYDLPESTEGAVEVGNPMSPDLEIIKSLNPSVVVSVDTLGSDYEKLFIDNNIPSEFVSLSSLDGLKETVRFLGEIFNKQSEAEEILNSLTSKEEQMALISEEEKPNVLVLFAAPGATMIATSESYIGNLVEIVGGNNIVDDTSSAYVTYSKEELAKLDPEKILVMVHALPEETKAALDEEMATDAAWQNIEAVKNGKVEYLDSSYFGMSANLKVIEGLDILHDIVHSKGE